MRTSLVSLSEDGVSNLVDLRFLLFPQVENWVEMQKKFEFIRQCCENNSGETKSYQGNCFYSVWVYCFEATVSGTSYFSSEVNCTFTNEIIIKHDTQFWGC